MLMHFRFVFPMLLVMLVSAGSCTAAPEQAKQDEPKPFEYKHEPGTTKNVIADIKKHTRPSDATQLVGKDKHIMVAENNPKNDWRYIDGELIASRKIRADSMLSPKPYGDMLMHVEFNCNDRDDTSVENTGNSGVYIQQRYELQIQNAFGISEEDFKPSYGGSLYRMKKPDKLVSKPAGQWQTYDIVFRAPRWDGDKKIANARITVYHNGVLIHDDFEMKRKTGAGMKEGPDDRPVRLQGHNNPVRFRNVWILPLDLK